MITKIIITQKKSKMANGKAIITRGIEIKLSPPDGDISKIEAAKLLVNALQTILEHKTASTDAQG